MWVTLNKICKTPQNSKTTHQLTASTFLKYFKPHRSFYRKKIKLAQLGTELDMMSTGVVSVLFHFFFLVSLVSAAESVSYYKGHFRMV